MAEEDRARHTLTNCRACPIGDDQQMYLLLRCNKIVEREHQEPAQQQPQQPNRAPAAVPQQQVPDPQGLFSLRGLKSCLVLHLIWLLGHHAEISADRLKKHLMNTRKTMNIQQN